MVRDELYKKYGEENVIRSGLRVKTTLNRAEQQYAETVVQNQVARLTGDSVTNGAAVVMDPKTGNILALVGSHDWFDANNGKVNMALSPRQPGSSFKPIIYSAAFSQRLITPATILEDVPTTFPDNYQPHDYDGKYRGPVTVRRALANSLNIPAVEVMEKVGVQQGISQAEMLGIDTLKDSSNYGLAFVLGAANVPLLELTNAYAIFANQGMYHPPTDILEIHDKYGHLVDTNKNEGQQVMDGGTAFLISSILSDNKAREEEFGSALTISRPAADKTGTTDNFRDALTIGYTPSLVVGAWVGNNDNAPMDNIAGSLGAAPIWRSLMEHFLAGTPVEQFTPPPDIVRTAVCAQFASAKSPSTANPSSEYFLSGTEPQNTTCSNNPSPQPTEAQPTFIFPTETRQTTPPTFFPPSPIPTEAPLGTPTMPPFPTIEITIPPFQSQF
jgi:membrane carboxypeptidase/penicillin-binding protein PbpC